LADARMISGIGNRKRFLMDEGIRLLQQPFWDAAPGLDMHSHGIVTDVLHQLYKGMVHDHLLSW